MRKWYFLLALLSLFGCEHPESNQYDRDRARIPPSSSDYADGSIKSAAKNTYKVVGIKDGDTFVLLMDGKEQIVRFANIDCPEKKQAFGTKAKQFVSEKCFGEYVTLVSDNKFDRYKRLLGEVILNDGTNLNKELIRNGLAWHYKKYSKDNDYATLELSAKQNRVGLWKDDNPTPPWDWRTSKKPQFHKNNEAVGVGRRQR